MRVLLLKFMAVLPLPILHSIGYMIGTVLYYTNRKSRVRALAHIAQSQLRQHDLTKAVKQNFVNLGLAAMETPYIWRRKPADIAKLIKATPGWEHVEEALQSPKGLILLTPHMGCFEITSLYYALHHPITVMYRPPKKQWVIPLMLQGRSHPNVTLAEANANGVRKLVKALKKGQAVGILPDQIPAAGEGEWADFFGKPAYTMTLASKLAQKTGATVLMIFGERLPYAQGYQFNVTKVDVLDSPLALNQAVERQIAQCPSQYYWHYNRYKLNRKAQADLDNELD